MSEILGPALNLRLYEINGGFDESGLVADLGYFVREHGPGLAKKLLPGMPLELLIRLQYAPDEFSYHLVGDRLVAAEDMKRGRLVDVRSRIDRQEPERGEGAYHLMGRIAAALADEGAVPDGAVLAWISPKEGFSEHAYLNIGTVTRDSRGTRMLAGHHYMSDFDQGTLLEIVSSLGGCKISPTTHPRIVSRMLFSVGSADAISAGEQIPAAGRIEGLTVRRLWGENSKSVWQVIRQVVGSSHQQISEVVDQARHQVENMKLTMATAVLGLITTVLDTISNGAGAATSSMKRFIELKNIDQKQLLGAFATAVAGCVGFGGVVSPLAEIAPSVIPAGQESDAVHCPNCNKNVHCAVGERCPGCRQIRPC